MAVYGHNIEKECKRPAMLKIMKYLNLPLPEDIEKAKYSGDFARALKMIDERLGNPSIPQINKNRLIIEKEILKRLPGEYPFDENEALQLIRKEIADFTKDELDALMDSGDADWFMIDGKRHLQKRFFASLKKVYPDIAQRADSPADTHMLLDQNIADMKKNCEASWFVRARHTLCISDTAFEPGRILVHLPLPTECMNMKEIRVLKTDPANAYISAPDHLARTVSFEIDLKENRPFSVEYSYISSVKYTDPDPKDALAETYETDSEAARMLVNEEIRMLADEIAQEETNPLILARRFYDFVTENVIYSYMRQYLTLGSIPEYCASRLRGDCGVQALLFIALCLSKGIPARWQSGKYVTPYGSGNHDWAMFYVKPWGWLFADCSFGGSAYRAGDKERHDYYFGNLDPFRMAANNGFLQEFDPPKKHWRIDPYDSQSGEAEYSHRGLCDEEIISQYEVLEMWKIS